MNIGIFTDTYYPQINGVVTSTIMLEKELSKLGHKVYIFTTTDPNNIEPNYKVFRVPSLPFVFLPTHRVGLVYPPKLLKLIKKLNLDIIHTQTEFPIGILGKTASALYKIPSVHTYHTMYEEYVHYFARGYLVTPNMSKRYSKLFCNFAKTVIAPTNKTKLSLIHYGVKKPIHVVPTGLDFSVFNNKLYTKTLIDKTKIDLGLNLTDPIVVYVGRIAKEKSLDIVIREFPKLLSKLPNVKLLIVGDGPLKNEITSLVASLGINESVIFAGSKKWEEIGLYYKLGDVFVSASTSETQGLTYIEAMVSRVPVVVKKDESTEDIIINNKTGYCFENDNVLASVLYKALISKNRERIIEEAYANVEKLSSYNFAKRVEKIYLDTINKHN